ncbi:MAG TPA: alpha/beta hydrolase [Gammaproteobacteria bacterium]
MTATVEFVDLDWDGRAIRIEYCWLRTAAAERPLMVFLHEGLGSLAMWKDFPAELCRRLDCRGLVYSRPGYGQSTPRPPAERWPVDFMHRQARQVLPLLLSALRIDTVAQPPWLLGHSDGASIALLYAAGFPERVAGVVALAPHIRVEELSVASIERARAAYLETDLRDRLARYHADPDSAFWGWNDIWLDPAFRDWSIDSELAAIRCPLLAVQGVDDEYGTLEQVHGIARRVDHARVVELAACGHSPQRDQPHELVELVAGFFATYTSADCRHGRAGGEG